MIKKVILVLNLLISIHLNAIDFSNLENKFIGVDLSIGTNISFGFDINKKSHLNNYVILFGDDTTIIGSNYYYQLKQIDNFKLFARGGANISFFNNSSITDIFVGVAVEQEIEYLKNKDIPLNIMYKLISDIKDIKNPSFQIELKWYFR